MMPPRSMKAVYYEDFGGPEVLQVGPRPIPDVADDEVLVQVAVAGVNPIDRRLRGYHVRQSRFTTDWPVIPGFDFSGRIVEVGNRAENWRIGDEIGGLAFSWHLHHGTYAEYVPVKLASISRKPTELSFVQAAALPLVTMTAWQGLAEVAGLAAGQSVLIQAGAGGVGSVAISIAKHLGAKVYSTCSTRNIEYVTSRGADRVIDYNNEDYVRVVRENEPDGLDCVFEPLSGKEFAENAIRLTKEGGHSIFLSDEPPELADIAERSIHAKLIHNRPDGKVLTELLPLFADGRLRLPHIDVLPLEQAREAHERLESWRTRGKMVLHVAEL